MKKILFDESKTKENIARSFASECMEGAKYQFLAQESMENDLDFLGNIFKTLAKHEMSHAKVFWKILHENSAEKIIQNIDLSFGYPFECTDFCENIQCHTKNEEYLSTNIYPEFAKIASDEGFEEISHIFKLVSTVENCHSLLLKQIYEKHKKNALYKSKEKIKWKCDHCGFEHSGKQPLSPCPLCGFDKGNCEIPFDMGN